MNDLNHQDYQYLHLKYQHYPFLTYQFNSKCFVISYLQIQ